MQEDIHNQIGRIVHNVLPGDIPDRLPFISNRIGLKQKQNLKRQIIVIFRSGERQTLQIIYQFRNGDDFYLTSGINYDTSIFIVDVGQFFTII